MGETEPLRTRLQHAWNAFRNKEPTEYIYREIGIGSSGRQDRTRLRSTTERSTIVSAFNRIAIDVSEISIQHVREDEEGRYSETIKSGLNYVLTTEANIDQTSKAFIQDVVFSMFDEGCVALVPVDTTGLDPKISDEYEIKTLRTAKIIEWYPKHIQVALYNDETGLRENITLPKRMVAIVDNPLYAIMNEPNSTLKRLVRKLNLLDSVDEQSSSGKLDLIIQLPYVIKTEARKNQAEIRRKDIEMQLTGSKYGIAYTDGTERITQLNRPTENNLMKQVEYLHAMLYSQLGLTENVFNGTADEAEMLNYYNRTIGPILSAIIDEIKRKFLTRTARSQRQSIMAFRDAFKLVPLDKLAEIGDKFTRNEILTSNEVRSIIGYRPSSDPKADKLQNKNMPETNGETPQNGTNN